MVDCLYFVVYEGPGGQDHRLLNIMTHDELMVVWRVKHLRSNYRHDNEHGKNGSIRKKYNHIGTTYADLIGKALPGCSADWIQMQKVLYVQVIDMLEEIRERLNQTI